MAIKLNIGCGNDIRLGYINIDKKKTHPSVIVDDMTVLGGVPANSVEELIAIGVLQYLTMEQLLPVLKLWMSKLIVGGKIYVEALDSNMLGNLMMYDNIQVNELNNNLFGRADDKYNAIYNLTVISNVLKDNGFRLVQKGYNGPNFYIEAVKNA